MPRTTDPLLRAAIADWQKLAPYVGLNPARFEPEPLARHKKPDAVRIVLLRWADFGRLGQPRSALAEARLASIQNALLGLMAPNVRAA